MSAPDGTPDGGGGARCPRCGAGLERDQDWCLTCGTAARTVIARTPGWRAPIAIVAVVAVLCGVAVAWAFVALTNDDAEVRAATAAPAPTTAPAPAATTPAPATTPPPAG